MLVTETVQVAAPPERVWAVLADVQDWPSWTPTTRSVRLLDGPTLTEGSRVRIEQPRLPPAEWVVSEYVPGRSFRWTARGPGVVTVADHEVVPADDPARSTVTLRLEQTGPLSGVLGLVAGRLTRRYVATEARSLKARCERGG